MNDLEVDARTKLKTRDLATDKAGDYYEEKNAEYEVSSIRRN